MAPISIQPAGHDDKATIANLIQLYLYDMTEFMPFPVEADGRFQYDFLERFWRFPYLIYAGSEIAGFALVVDTCPLTDTTPCWFMAEFFVLKAYRHAGVGRTAFNLILQHHPGPWRIGVPHANLAARAFWQKALVHQTLLENDLSFAGDDWRLHDFTV